MFDNIVLFTYLVEIGSFTKTAEKVNLSQATLSKRIIDLENQLDKQLFIRDTRNIQLTVEGGILYERFKRMRGELKSVIQELNPRALDNKPNELKVSLPTALSYELICPFINQFCKDHPEVKLNLYFQTQQFLFDEDVFDLALTHYNYHSEKSYTKFLRREIGQFFCTPEYVSKYGLPQTIEELEALSIIGLMNVDTAEVEEYVTLVNRYTGEKILYSNKKHATITSNLVTHIKKIGMNMDIIFACWAFLCEKEVTQGKLIPVLPEYESSSLSYYLVTKKNLSSLGHSFGDFLFRCLKRNSTIML